MLPYLFIDPYQGVEKEDSKFREHCFWNGGLRHQLHISTWDSAKFHEEPAIFFCDKREQLLNFLLTSDLHFYALIIGFFTSA